MGELNEKNYNYNEENDREEIIAFLSKKRRQIMQILYAKGRLSHGELAEAVNTSAASLSNILLKFDSFQHKLLDNESEGKRRFYFLTEKGRQFIEAEYQENGRVECENVVFHESFLSIHKLEESLGEIQKRWGEKWGIALDNALIACISYGQIRLGKEGSEIDEKEIKEFIWLVENALLNDYENNIYGVMKVIGTNLVLQDRMVQFLEQFDAFRPLLIARKNGKTDELKVYEFLEELIIGDGNGKYMFGAYAQELQWDEKEYTLFSEMVEEIIMATEKKNKTDIYHLLNRYMAGDRDLSAFLAMQIDKRHKNDGMLRES